MRTTVDIPDAIYRRLKSRAASEGRSTKALILRGVKEVLRTTRQRTARKVSLPIVKSKRPGSVGLDNARIYEIVPFP
jgi:plasmid stability protein